MGSTEWSTIIRFRAIALVAGGFVTVMSLLILFGWVIGEPTFIRLFGPTPISPISAFCFLLLGPALLVSLHPSPLASRLRWWLALLPLGLGLFVLADPLIALETGRPPRMIPMAVPPQAWQDAWLMSYTTALAVVLLAGALLLRGRASKSLALVAFAFSYVVDLAMILQVQYLYGSIDFLPGMPLTLTLSLGILLSQPETGWMRVMASPTPTGIMLRRLLPIGLALPPLFAWYWDKLQDNRFLETPTGTFLLVIVMTALLLAFVWWNVHPINRLEEARKRAEDALRRREAEARELAAIVESSQDAIATMDPQLRAITFWNEGAEKLFGWTAEEAIGQPPTITTPPELFQSFQRAAERLRQGIPMEVFDSMALCKDGSRVEVSASVFPIKDDEGRITGFSTIQRDITERKQAVEEMARRTAELRKAKELNQLKDHFLSTISHEMKTPLSLIVGYTELLEDTCPGTPVVEGIKEGSRRLTEHIDNILDYSALISGTLPLYRTEVNLAEIAENVSAVVADEVRQKDQTMEVEVAPDTPILCGDSRRITQILHELLKNAEKFTPAGGKMGLRIAPEGDMVRLDVWDTGPGIPEDDFGRIWEAFSQLTIGDSVRTGGLGLGLTIVKKLVELHGGRVAVVSQLGQGSTFSIFLPIGQEEVPPPAAGDGTGHEAPGPAG